MKSKTKIICTIGPASRRKETIIKMANAGMAIARLNFSHGSHEEHQQVIETIKEINKEKKYNIEILQDLAGYRIRVGTLDRPIGLIRHQTIHMSNVPSKKTGVIPLLCDDDMQNIKKGMNVFIDDGHLHLKVTKVSNKTVILEVVQGGPLKSKKGVNIPKLKLKSNILTEKDRQDIEFGIKNQVDYIAQSFVRNKNDVIRVSQIVKKNLPGCRVISKIENEQGVRNVESIMGACEGILVARGDLGVSVPIYQIPIIQKKIIQLCNQNKKPVITATQMLESMTNSARPTRAEVSDVANAILDGTNFVMLSGETAVGTYPVKSVRMMSQIIGFTERSM